MGWKRTLVGEVLKSKDDDTKSYIKVKEPMEAGKTYNLESAKEQLSSLESALADGKLSEEIGANIRERIEKIPDFVRFQIIKVERTND